MLVSKSKPYKSKHSLPIEWNCKWFIKSVVQWLPITPHEGVNCREPISLQCSQCNCMWQRILLLPSTVRTLEQLNKRGSICLGVSLLFVSLLPSHKLPRKYNQITSVTQYNKIFLLRHEGSCTSNIHWKHVFFFPSLPLTSLQECLSNFLSSSGQISLNIFPLKPQWQQFNNYAVS